MKNLNDNLEVLDKIIKYSFYTLIIILILYILVLVNNKLFLSFSDSFSLEVTYQISAFLGVILTALFSVGSAYLLLKNYLIIKETYLETKNINTHFITKDESERIKQEKALSSNLAKLFFWEIQPSYIKLKEFGIFSASENTINYLDMPFRIQIDTSDYRFTRASGYFIHNGNHIKITEHLDKLEYLSLSILNDKIDSNLIEKFLRNKFLEQVKTLLIYLAFCRSDNENYGESILELYIQWKGE